MLSFMQEMKSEISGINTRLNGIDNRLDKIKIDIEETKENTAIIQMCYVLHRQ